MTTPRAKTTAPQCRSAQSTKKRGGLSFAEAQADAEFEETFRNVGSKLYHVQWGATWNWYIEVARREGAVAKSRAAAGNSCALVVSMLNLVTLGQNTVVQP